MAQKTDSELWNENTHHLLFGKIGPIFFNTRNIRSATEYKQPITTRGRLTPRQRPGTSNTAAGHNAELPVNAPGIGVFGIGGMIHHRNARPVSAAFDGNGNRHPLCALSFSVAIGLPLTVDGLASKVSFVGRTQERDRRRRIPQR